MQPHPDLSPIPDLDEDLITGLDNFIADHVHPEAGTLSRNDAINRILGPEKLPDYKPRK